MNRGGVLHQRFMCSSAFELNGERSKSLTISLGAVIVANSLSVWDQGKVNKWLKKDNAYRYAGLHIMSNFVLHAL